MDDASLDALLALAVTTGLLHTLAGPDHYVPFVILARARGWSRRRTVLVTGVCGLGHVLGSVLLGLVGIAVGLATSRMEGIEFVRGRLAAWLMIGFGLGYAAWGLRRAIRHQEHRHRHFHPAMGWHTHRHAHTGGHAHLHARPGAGTSRSLTPWVLFLVFIFGPCEVLIPQLMVPAARSDWIGLAAVAGLFGATTILTMIGLVLAFGFGMKAVRLGILERFTPALAGLAIVLCGVLMLVGP